MQRHVLGRLAIVAGKRGDGVERIEEEMRLELDLQYFELGARQLSLELRRDQLTLLVLSVEGDGLRDQ